MMEGVRAQSFTIGFNEEFNDVQIRSSFLVSRQMSRLELLIS